jgi:hypothetical protein
MGGSKTGNPTIQSPKAQGKGQFKAVYGPVKNPDYVKAQAEQKKERVLESLAEMLNKEIAIPSDLTLTYTECNTVNAFYDPQHHQINM